MLYGASGDDADEANFILHCLNPNYTIRASIASLVNSDFFVNVAAHMTPDDNDGNNNNGNYSCATNTVINTDETCKNKNVELWNVLVRTAREIIPNFPGLIKLSVCDMAYRTVFSETSKDTVWSEPKLRDVVIGCVAISCILFNADFPLKTQRRNNSGIVLEKLNLRVFHPEILRKPKSFVDNFDFAQVDNIDKIKNLYDCQQTQLNV
jgi:hypothetical protein